MTKLSRKEWSMVLSLDDSLEAEALLALKL